MGRFNEGRRAGSQARAGRGRAGIVAARLGTALRDARTSTGLTQTQVATRAAVSQPLISQLERGRGRSASIETWSVVAAAVGEQFVGFLEYAPGAGQPRDIEHLRRQSALIAITSAGGWLPCPSWPLIGTSRARARSMSPSFDGRPGRWSSSRSGTGSRKSVEPCAGSMERWRPSERGLTQGEPWQIRGLFVVRDTRRNRQLISELRPLFTARFTADSRIWLKALTQPSQALPAGDSLLRSDRAGTVLRPSRLRG